MKAIALPAKTDRRVKTLKLGWPNGVRITIEDFARFPSSFVRLVRFGDKPEGRDSDDANERSTFK